VTRRWSIRVARIGGIDVRLHVSMLLLAWLVAAYAPEDPHGWAGATAWVTTIFVCVLVHEFAHSFVARRLGIAVHEIELYPIGGMSKIERMPDNPGKELKIALAGPATSVVIGLTFLAVTAITEAGVPRFDLVGGPMPIRVGWFNLVIGAFNLLPALPLDGGRALRALFEAREGPLVATHHAARIARRLAWVLILVGALGNVFLMIIGLFVHVVSRTEEFNAEVHHSLGELRTVDVMVREPLVLAPTASIGQVRDLASRTTQRQYPVADADGYVGLVDLRRLAAKDDDTLIADVMSTAAPVDPDAVVETVDWTGSDAVAVVRRGVVVGLLRREDVVLAAQRALAQAVAAESPARATK
jgi:stage IV sporulation protein FB